jgi:cyclopropane fatty-acyl-phospholipid synthase-like methyltransferase
MGAAVTGVDAAAENVAAAQAHAAGGGLAITYRLGEIGALDLAGFDLVTAMEVIEHVADKPAFVAALAAALGEDGLMVLSTPNRTPQHACCWWKGRKRWAWCPAVRTTGTILSPRWNCMTCSPKQAWSWVINRYRLQSDQGLAPVG